MITSISNNKYIVCHVYWEITLQQCEVEKEETEDDEKEEKRNAHSYVVPFEIVTIRSCQHFQYLHRRYESACL